MRKIKFWRIGSDPELVFARMEEWRCFVVPASTVISNNRTLTTTTFIGTDGHPATAELRPPPSHNVKRHLYDIASAVDAMHTYIKGKAKFKDLTLMAQPTVGAEPLGGHIHLSFLVHEPDTARAINLNRFYDVNSGGIVAYDNNVMTPNVSVADGEFLGTYADRANRGRLTTATEFSKVIAYLGQPLECWLQPWFSRTDRNGRYGRGADVVRWQRSPRPTLSICPPTEWAYLHYEYRMPSTWLAHPYLAHAYLATAKLMMLNYPIIHALVAGKETGYEPLPKLVQSDKAYNNDMRAVFYKRLDQLEQAKGYRCSNDIKDLRRTLLFVDKTREKWFEPTSPVDIEAWKGLI